MRIFISLVLLTSAWAYDESLDGNGRFKTDKLKVDGHFEFFGVDDNTKLPISPNARNKHMAETPQPNEMPVLKEHLLQLLSRNPPDLKNVTNHLNPNERTLVDHLHPEATTLSDKEQTQEERSIDYENVLPLNLPEESQNSTEEPPERPVLLDFKGETEISTEPFPDFGVSRSIEDNFPQQFVKDLRTKSREVGSALKGTTEIDEVSLCHLKPDTGVCRAYINRWFYSPINKTCNKFVYGGCQGNDNNFHKEYHCYAACKGEIPCPNDPKKVCQMSESPCLNATCRDYPEAKCAVLPCTCQAVFEDKNGNALNCEKSSGKSTDEETVDLDMKVGNITDIKDGRVANPNNLDVYSEHEIDRKPTTNKSIVFEISTPSNESPITTNKSIVFETSTPSIDEGPNYSKEDLGSVGTKGPKASPDAGVSGENVTEIDENLQMNTTDPTIHENSSDASSHLSKREIIWLSTVVAITLIVVILALFYCKWKRMRSFNTGDASIQNDSRAFFTRSPSNLSGKV